MIKVEISDDSAFGISHHNHNKHTVIVSGLDYEQAQKIKVSIDNLTGIVRTPKSYNEFYSEYMIFWRDHCPNSSAPQNHVIEIVYENYLKDFNMINK